VKKMMQYVFVLSVVSMLLFSCKKEKKFDITPAITFKSFSIREYKPTQGFFTDVVVNFTDGDGDIGLKSSDTLPPYDNSSVFYYNCFIQRQKKVNGVFVNTPSFNYRIPYIVPESRNKNIEGEIKVEVFYLDDTPGVADTVRLEMYIADRALQLSNKITTTELILP
jgi:hypothetical protein